MWISGIGTGLEIFVEIGINYGYGLGMMTVYFTRQLSPSVMVDILYRSYAVVAGMGSVQLEVESGKMSLRGVIVNPLHAVRHRRNAMQTTEDVNIMSTTSAANNNTAGAANMTLSSHDVTSLRLLQSDTTTVSSVQTSTQNTSRVNVKTVNFVFFSLSFPNYYVRQRG